MAKGKYHKWLTEEGLIKIKGWAKDGLSDEQIAHNIGVNPSTLYDWKKKYPKISEALDKSKEVADFKVENALYKKALGYHVKMPQQKVLKDGSIVEYEQTVYIQPDTTAQKFWLINRQKGKWKDSKQLDVGNVDNQPFKINDMTEEQRKKRREELRKKMSDK